MPIMLNLLTNPLKPPGLLATTETDGRKDLRRRRQLLHYRRVDELLYLLFLLPRNIHMSWKSFLTGLNLRILTPTRTCLFANS
jgi:hypothetical protein